MWSGLCQPLRAWRDGIFTLNRSLWTDKGLTEEWTHRAHTHARLNPSLTRKMKASGRTKSLLALTAYVPPNNIHMGLLCTCTTHHF
jgi:hypothetical protein